MSKIDDMNQIFLSAKTMASVGASLAGQTIKVIEDMDIILAKLAAIQADREAADNLHLMIGDEGMVHVAAVAAIMYEASMKVKALEAV